MLFFLVPSSYFGILFTIHSGAMYVLSHIYKSINQPGKVTNPARDQLLNRGN